MNFSYLSDLKNACESFPAKGNNKNEQYLPLWMHLTDTMIVINYLYHIWLPDSIKDRWNRQISLPGFWSSILLFCAGTHDIGKETSLFVYSLFSAANIPAPFAHPEYLSEPSRTSRIRHDLAGNAILLYFAAKDSLMGSLASVCGSHHGNFQSSLKCKNALETYDHAFYGAGHSRNIDQELFWENTWKQTIEAVKKISGYQEKWEYEKIPHEDLMLISTLVVMADWIASDPSLFPLLEPPDEDSLSLYPERGESALKKAGISPAWNPEKLDENEFNFTKQFGFEPNEMQKTFIEAAQKMTDSELIIIESSTGSGKTEAALAAANILAARQRYGGIYFALPTRATSDGLFSRIAKWIQPEAEKSLISFRLAHGKALLNPEYEAMLRNSEDTLNEAAGLRAAGWLCGYKRELLSDIVVGTIDQSLIGAVQTRHVMLRLGGLAGKICIFDEIHSFDSYTSAIIDRLLQWLGALHVPVILLSATLSPARRIEMIESYMLGKTGQEKSVPPASPFETVGKILKKTAFSYPSPVQTLSFPLITWTSGREIYSRKFQELNTPEKKVRFTILKPKNDPFADNTVNHQEVSASGVPLSDSAGTFTQTTSAGNPECKDYWTYIEINPDKEEDKKKNAGAEKGKIADKNNEKDSGKNTKKEANRDIGNGFNLLSYVGIIAGLAKELLSEGGCGLVLVNRVHSAQILYKTLKEALADSGIKLLLIHSRFADSDRKEREQEVMNVLDRNRKFPADQKTLVISSPVLEQSLDIDADFLMTQLCPGDLMIQRIGRLHRNSNLMRPEKLKIPHCFLLGMDESEFDSIIYPSYLLYQTAQWLKANEVSVFPEAVPKLMTAVYGEETGEILSENSGQIQMEVCQSEKTLRINRMKKDYENKYIDKKKDASGILLPVFKKRKGKTASLNQLKLSTDVDEKYLKVRSEEESVEVLIIQKLSENFFVYPETNELIEFPDENENNLVWIDRNSELIKKLKLQRVSLPTGFSHNLAHEHVMKKMESDSEQIYPGWKKVFKNPFLVLDENGCVEIAGKHLRYTKEIGLFDEDKR